MMAGGLALLSEAAPAWAQPAGTISVRDAGRPRLRSRASPFLSSAPSQVRLPSHRPPGSLPERRITPL